MSTHRSFDNHSSPNYQSSIQHHDNPNPNYLLIVEDEYIAQQIGNQYPVLPSVEVEGPYYPSPNYVVSQGPYYPSTNYEQIDDVYVHLTESYQTMIDWEIGDSRYDFRSLYNHDHEEKEDDVLKYLKIRTHHAPDKDGVVTDVESDICAICQSEYEHEESIGTLHCRHEYHTNCIKQWLLKKKDCPMCRASVLPSQ